MARPESLKADRTSSRSGRAFNWFIAARVGPLQGGGLWGSLAVIAAFLAISIPQYGQPYVIDEAAFPYAAEGVLKHGAPFFYNGETRPNDLGLWHPPLYVYLLAGQIGIWGMSTFAVRSFGAICVIASFFILTLALKRIAPDIKQYGYVVMGALFLLNPLVVSDALVPDIDGTLGVFLLAMAIWVSTLVAQRALSWRWVVGLFALAIFAVSTKFILAGLVAVIVAGATMVSSSQRWWKLLWAFLAFVAGTGAALLLLFALGAVAGFDALGPFDYLFGSLGSKGPGHTGIGALLNNLMFGSSSNVVWIGPAILVTAILALVAVHAFKPPGVSRSLATLTLVASLLILVGYSYITGSPFGFPKYTSVVVLGLALVTSLVVTLLPGLLPDITGRTRRLVNALGTGFAVVLILLTIGAYAIAARYESTQPRKLHELVYLAVGVGLGVLVVMAVLSYVLSSDRGRGKSGLRRPLLIGVIASLVFTPIVVQTSSSLVNLTSPFSTRYYYRERGLSDFLAQADRVIPAGAMVIAPKDVGLQLGRPFYEDAQILPMPAAKFRAELDKIQVPYLVTRALYDYSEFVYPDQFQVLREFYEAVLQNPDWDFTLWKLKDRPLN